MPGSGASPQSPHEAPAHLSQVLGVEGSSSPEWSPFFASRAAGQAEGLLLVEVAGHAGRGKHHWPSESGIETDGRGEQHYHSKDPMGAVQQIPY